MSKIIAKIAGLFSLSCLVLAVGCSKTEKGSRLKVGVIAGPEEEVAQVACEVAKARFGLMVELVPFSDYVTPNAALADGSIDANAFQHRPFLEQQVKDRGYKIEPVGSTFVYPIAAYSRRHRKDSELPKGAQIAIPNDPTNRGRSLLLLQKQGLITLRENAGLDATVQDVTGSRLGLRIVELEAPLLPRSLDDVDLAIINTTYASQAGLNPVKDGLFMESKDSLFVNLIVARSADKDAEAIRHFVQSFQSDEVYNAAQKIFGGAVIKGW
jgi:D-methionine transport system substrate-binding protein